MEAMIREIAHLRKEVKYLKISLIITQVNMVVLAIILGYR